MLKEKNFQKTNLLKLNSILNKRNTNEKITPKYNKKNKVINNEYKCYT